MALGAGNALGKSRGERLCNRSVNAAQITCWFLVEDRPATKLAKVSRVVKREPLLERVEVMRLVRDLGMARL